MEGPVLMECYEDVFEEIASKFYSDEPLTKSLSTDPFVMAARFGARLRSGNLPLGLHPPSQFLHHLHHHHHHNHSPAAIAPVAGNENALLANSSDEASSAAPVAKTNGVVTDDVWLESSSYLSWTSSKVARYNPSSKMYKCVDCDTMGFLSRIAEHWLGTHANLKVFRCPRCPYSSAWARCVRMHLTRHHNEQHSDAALWKDNQTLEEVVQLLQNLRNGAEEPSKGDNTALVEQLSDKRYACPQCPYATDRRDLYTRHENIHKEDKPFHCYVCYKMFSRADHVKKHFFRMHKDRPYDINLIRRHPPKATPADNNNHQPIHQNNNNTFPSYYPSALAPLPASHSLQCQMSNTEDSFGHNHSKKRRLPKMFTCNYCSWRGVDNWCLKRHLNTHIKPYLCVLCDYKAARAERLSTHVLKIHNKRICNKCNFLAEDQSQLNHHVRETHGHERGIVKCEECPETFDTDAEVETHGILVHNKELIDCDDCDFKTTHRESLERHQAERHAFDSSGGGDGDAEGESEGGGGDGSSASGGCGSEPLTVTKPSIHNKEIRCRECGCEFANQSSLQTHCLLLHRSQRVTPRHAYMCSVCQYGCASQINMMEHMRVHTGEVLQCQAQDCAFRTPFDSVLREHVHFVHNDDFIIRCPHCGYSVSTRHGWIRHYPAHHAQLCSLCLSVIRKHFPGQDFTKEPNNGTKAEVSQSGTSQQHVDSNGKPTAAASTPQTSSVVSSMAQVELQVFAQVKRSRKQSKPRKIIQTDDDDDDDVVAHKRLSEPSPKLKSTNRNQRLRQLLKPHRFAYMPQHRCRLCRRFPVAYNLKRNLILHWYWRHNRKPYACHQCQHKFTHQYQVMLHTSRMHGKHGL